MPLDCPHGGPWMDEERRPFGGVLGRTAQGGPVGRERGAQALPMRTCALIKGGCATCGPAYIHYDSCKDCSGRDDGTSVASWTLNDQMATLFIGNPLLENLEPLVKRSRTDAEDALVRAVRIGCLTTMQAKTLAAALSAAERAEAI